MSSRRLAVASQRPLPCAAQRTLPSASERPLPAPVPPASPELAEVPSQTGLLATSTKTLRASITRRDREVKKLEQTVNRDIKKPPKDAAAATLRSKKLSRDKATLEALREELSRREDAPDVPIQSGGVPNNQVLASKGPGKRRASPDDLSDLSSVPSDSEDEGIKPQANSGQLKQKKQCRASGNQAGDKHGKPGTLANKEIDVVRPAEMANPSVNNMREDGGRTPPAAETEGDNKSVEILVPVMAHQSTEPPNAPENGGAGTNSSRTPPVMDKLMEKDRSHERTQDVVASDPSKAQLLTELPLTEQHSKDQPSKQKAAKKQPTKKSKGKKPAAGDNGEVDSKTEYGSKSIDELKDLEKKTIAAVKRFLETGGSNAISCYPLARDSLVTRCGMLKCVYHALVDKNSKKRDKEGEEELLGVPYAPTKADTLNTAEGKAQGSAFNRLKLLKMADGEEYCHCGCRLEDAIWGLWLWKTGKIEYNGVSHGYELQRKPPTPSQRNFEITRLKGLGVRLQDLWTHELVLGKYQERSSEQIIVGRINALVQELKVVSRLNAPAGNLEEELKNLIKMDEDMDVGSSAKADP
ncbi:hypothetical protein V5O48_012889 [Marasmius crinis-equi]|uniref:Uncharacterized protein n=1 Tax=Marasmius crinis-equi TaxID=585013 RepID=A0ABR3F1K8_9AGAR